VARTLTRFAHRISLSLAESFDLRAAEVPQLVIRAPVSRAFFSERRGDTANIERLMKMKP
jgi:hypothetical protein